MFNTICISIITLYTLCTYYRLVKIYELLKKISEKE